VRAYKRLTICWPMSRAGVCCRAPVGARFRVSPWCRCGGAVPAWKWLVVPPVTSFALWSW